MFTVLSDSTDKTPWNTEICEKKRKKFDNSLNILIDHIHAKKVTVHKHHSQTVQYHKN